MSSSIPHIIHTQSFRLIQRTEDSSQLQEAESHLLVLRPVCGTWHAISLITWRFSLLQACVFQS